MALNEGAQSNTTWLNVADGRLVQQFKTPEPATAERITKTGKQVYEKFYRDLSGIITALETRENDYGKQWAVTIVDGEERYVINLSASSRYATSLLKCLPNLRLASPIKLMPWSMADKNDATKKITGITLYQNDGDGWVKVAPAYTRDAPNGLPEMIQVKIKGKLTWDSSDMDEFLEKMAKSLFNNIDNEEPPF